MTQPDAPATLTIPQVQIDPTPPVMNEVCAACGQLDDHPMIHTNLPEWVDLMGNAHRAPSFHFDCLPGDMEYRLGTDATHPEHKNTRDTIAAARAGTHGHELRAFIHDLARKHNDNAVGAGGHHADGLTGDVTRPVGDSGPAPTGESVAPSLDTEGPA